MSQNLNISAPLQRIRPPRFLALGLAVVFLLLTAGPGRAADDWLADTNWLNRTKITFDNSDQTTDDLVNFPVLVKLNTTDLPNLDLSTTVGADVRFTDAVTGDELKYEVEAWDADTATVWVKVPQIDKSSDTDYIWVYYNYNGTATYDQSAADEQAVWDANYKAVWHLKESSTGTLDDFADSTANANHGQGGDGASGDTPTQIAGQIGTAQDFDGTSEFIAIPKVENDVDVTEGTMSAWIALDPVNDWKVAIEIRSVTADNTLALWWNDGGENFDITIAREARLQVSAPRRSAMIPLCTS